MALSQWAIKLAKAQREGDRRVPSQYRCEACNAVEFGSPHCLCSHCSLDYYSLRELAKAIWQRFNLWHLKPAEAIKESLNRMVNEVNARRIGK